MIRLEDVSHYYGSGNEARCVLYGINCDLDTSHSIGVLGLNGTGKSTLLRILAGSMEPTSGRVTRSCRVSWPLGLNGFSGSLSGEENLRFVCRIYGADRRAVLAFVADFAELGDDLHKPVRTYSSGMKARLSLALSLAIHFDTYLIDEGLSVGDVRFQERYSQAIRHRFSESRVIIVSHHMRTIRKYCTKGVVLHDSRLSDVLPIDEAAHLYKHVINLKNNARSNNSAPAAQT